MWSCSKPLQPRFDCYARGTSHIVPKLTVSPDAGKANTTAQAKHFNPQPPAVPP